MKNIFSSVLLGAVCALPAVATACSCAPPPAPKIALQQSVAVFVGRVMKVAPIQSDNPIYAGNKYQFTVSKKWKGVVGNSVSIVSASNSAACGINFDSDRDYLVYAFKNKGDDQLRTNLCTRTKRAADAAADLAELGAPGNEAQNAATVPVTIAPLVIHKGSAVQIKAASAQPLALLSRVLKSDAKARTIRLNWDFNQKPNTFPPTIRKGYATALYNRDDSTLKLYAKYNDAVGNHVKHVLYRGVTDEKLRQLASKYQSDDAQENFAFLDKLPEVGASATDLGSLTQKRRVLNLK